MVVAKHYEYIPAVQTVEDLEERDGMLLTRVGCYEKKVVFQSLTIWHRRIFCARRKADTARFVGLWHEIRKLYRQGF